MAVMAKLTAQRFGANMVAEAEALGRATARTRPVGRGPSETQTFAHGRRRAGPGSAFWQYRAYAPGEPIRNIDWRRSARGDSAIVREREWEAALILDIWVDASRSMDFPTARSPMAKRHTADMLVLAAASAWLENGERVRVLNDLRPANTSGLGKIGSVVTALARAASNLGPAGQEDLPPRVPAPRQGFVLLVGDFLTPVSDFAERTATLARRGARGVAIQVLHPHEIELPATGRVEFASLEASEQHLLRNVALGQKQYRQRMTDHSEALRTALARFGWGFVQHRTDAPLRSSLTRALALLAADGA